MTDSDRGTRPSRIRFTLPDGVPPARLPLSLHAAADGQRVEIRTERLQASLAELLRWAGESGVELAGLDARSGSPEEAFVEIAGPGVRPQAAPRAGTWRVWTSPRWPGS